MAFASLIALAADEKPRGPGVGNRPQDTENDAPRFLFKTDVPAHPLDVVLGRPTDKAKARLSKLSPERR